MADDPVSSTQSPWRWWCAVLVGIILALPIGWLLSLAGPLPFFLGPFFFALLGLIGGATVHRIAAKARPYRPIILWTGTTLIVVICWGSSMLFESRRFVINTADEVTRTTRYLGTSVKDFRQTVADDIRSYLAANYPPGGSVGYMRWIAVSGQIPDGALTDVHRVVSAGQRTTVWIMRVILSIGLLAFGVGSQTLVLRRASDPPVRAIDAHDAES